MMTDPGSRKERIQVGLGPELFQNGLKKQGKIENSSQLHEYGILRTCCTIENRNIFTWRGHLCLDTGSSVKIQEIRQIISLAQNNILACLYTRQNTRIYISVWKTCLPFPSEIVNFLPLPINTYVYSSHIFFFHFSPFSLPLYIQYIFSHPNGIGWYSPGGRGDICSFSPGGICVPSTGGGGICSFSPRGGGGVFSNVHYTSLLNRF